MEHDMTTMQEYHEEVREAILRRNGKPILNGTIDHAAVIVQESFNNAKNRVRILSSRLDPSCYAKNSVADAAKTFLADPDHKAEILVEPSLWDADDNFEWGKHPLVAALSDYKDRFEIRIVPSDWVKRYNFNFLLLDDYGYRYEGDRSRPAAVAAFLPSGAEKPQVNNLNKIFDELWQHSKPYQEKPYQG
jgi:hypothetical protein